MTWIAKDAYDRLVAENARLEEQLAKRNEAIRALAQTCQWIVELSAGWDDDGSLGPRSPLSWESAACMAMDYARAALGEHAQVIADAKRGSAMTPAKALADWLQELHPDDDHECCLDARTVAQAVSDWFREQRPTQSRIEDLLWDHFRRDKQTVATIQFAATAILALWDAKERET